MKIIFLDIDGVLNSYKWIRSEEYKLETIGLSNAQVMLFAHKYHLDPSAINILNKLVQDSGAEVVLSSTWRIKYSVEEMTTMLQGRGATFSIKNKTPVLYGKLSERIPRGKEIKEYLSKLEVQPESFVILDDINNMLNLKKYLVLTSDKLGITNSDSEKALKILNGELEGT